jgi:pyruvate formate-lyase activating enzyme-like uncharacterized protein
MLLHLIKLHICVAWTFKPTHAMLDIGVNFINVFLLQYSEYNPETLRQYGMSYTTIRDQTAMTRAMPHLTACEVKGQQYYDAMDYIGTQITENVGYANRLHLCTTVDNLRTNFASKLPV